MTSASTIVNCQKVDPAVWEDGLQKKVALDVQAFPYLGKGFNPMRTFVTEFVAMEWSEDAMYSIKNLSDQLVDAMPWLDKAADVAHKMWDPLLGAEGPAALKNALYGTWLGQELAIMIPDLTAVDLDPARGYPVVETWTDTRWQLTVAGQLVRDEPNPYGWIPYVIATNDPRPFAFWGQSDLIDLVDVCMELNERMTVLSRVLELSGAPIAVLENVDGSEGINIGPGAKWELPEGAKAYLLDLLQGGGTDAHVSYIELLFRSLHDLSETPRTAFGDSGRDLSGAALEVEIQPLVQKVGRKRRMWDAFFARRNALLLDLLERFGHEDLDGLRQTTTIWPPVLPSDTDSAIRNAVSLVSSGIRSRRTAIATLGSNDPDTELARIAEESRTLTLPAIHGVPPS